MDGPCMNCKSSEGPGISWKYNAPDVVNDIVVYKRHRYCLKCAVLTGHLSADEAKQLEAARKLERQKWPLTSTFI